MLVETGARLNFFDVASWIGRFFLQWGNFEVALREFDEARSCPRPFDDRLSRWLDRIEDGELSSANRAAIRSDLKQIYAMRNHIAHGLIGAGLDDDDEGSITCRSHGYGEPDGSLLVTYTLAEIEAGTRMLAQVQSVMWCPERLIEWPDEFL